MFAIDAVRAEEVLDNLENCRRLLERLGADVGEISYGLGLFSGMEEVRKRLEMQADGIQEEGRILVKMEDCLLTGIRLCMDKDLAVAGYVEEVQSAGIQKTGEWETPQWAFALLG